MALLPVEQALTQILKGVIALPPETIAIDEALGRVLAKSVMAKRDQPPFAASAMDGYAVRHADLAEVPAVLKVAGVSAAGRGFRQTLKPGQAVRIMTGAPLPPGADTVVIQENTSREGDVLHVLEAAVPGRNIRRQGLDFARGDLLLAAGQRLRPRDIGLAAAGNAARLRVHRKTHISFFATGDELVRPGARPGTHQITSSNSSALAAMATSLGAEVSNLGIVRDSLSATKAAIRRAMDADILVTTGGASVGDHDFVQEAFQACGITLQFWKIAMRPGKPFKYGRKGKLHVMGLPGNPVSALVTARLFLKPLVDTLHGLPRSEDITHAVLERAMPANDSRQDYVRATLRHSAEGRRHVAPIAVQDSSMQRTLQGAQCLIIRAPHAEAATIGQLVPVLLLDF